MAGERSLDGDLRRFLVPNFTNQNHIRIMPQNRAQPLGKGQSGLFRNLDLIDAPQLIFDRVFNRNDLAHRIVNFVERGIEGRGFAAAGRSGDENDSVRQLKHSLERLELALVHAKLLHAQQGGVLPQQPHHHRFTVQHRYYRYTNVHLAVVQPDLDAAILRQPLFRDVQMAQNFDAGNDGRLKTLDLGRHRHVLQYAVDAVADAKFVFERFEVNVRGAKLDGISQHLVHKSYDGGILGRI